MSIFEDIVLKSIVDNANNKKEKFAFDINTINRVSDNITPGNLYLVTGRSGSGKTSFIDTNFVFNLYNQWLNIDEHKKPPLKIFYYGMKVNFETKLKKLTCTTLYRRSQNFIVDVPTLDSSPGKVFNMNKRTLERVARVKDFVNDLTDHIEYVHTASTVEQIYNTVDAYCKTLGRMVEDEWHYDEGKEDHITVVIVDSVEQLKASVNGHGYTSPTETQRLLADYMKRLKTQYSIIGVVSHPTRSLIRNRLDSVPKFSDMGVFEAYADVAFAMFNPYNEGFPEWRGFKPNEWIFARGVNRLRFLTILRNVNGIDNYTIPLVFIPENGIMKEAPPVEDESEIEMQITILSGIK